jgi:hypothetical protein
MVRAAKPQANRTDLLSPAISPTMPGQPNGNPNQPNVQATGLPYGESGQLHQGQSAAPLPNSQGSQLAQAIQDAHNTPAPNQTGLTPLDAPTERPYEHVMTGASGPFGIGAPAATPPAPAAGAGENGQANDQLANLFDQIAQASGSQRMQELAAQARSHSS